MQLKQRLSEYRKASGISQEEASEKLNVSRQTISRWEHGQSVPSTENLLKLSELYGVSLDALVNDNWTPPAEPEQIFSPFGPESKAPKKPLRRLWGLGTALFVAVAMIGILLFWTRFEHSVSIVEIESEVIGDISLVHVPVLPLESDNS